MAYMVHPFLTHFLTCMAKIFLAYTTLGIPTTVIRFPVLYLLEISYQDSLYNPM